VRSGCGRPVVWTGRLTLGAHTVSLLSPNYPNRLNLKNENGCLNLIQNSQFLHVGRLGYYERFPKLCRHPIPNRSRVKSPGTDSTFESLLNFKRGLNLLKNMVNSLKFFLELLFTKVNLIGTTCMQECELPYKCQMAGFE
jgi:hypothetical protein